uniref:C-type lectin domain-containing protein n=1 Tax=Cyprinus carpio TaxID=7962 RepID=A0A8C2IQR6_CYPCA
MNQTKYFLLKLLYQMSFCFKASTGFVREQDKKNWTDAQKYCRQKHTDLASVRNESENNQIENMLQDDQVWIGLHRLWVWSDNSTATFTHWRTGEPSIGTNRNSICVSTGINKLVLIRENKTWTEALRYCRDRDMDLVSVDSEQMQQRVMNVTSSALSDHVWLGLRHSCTVGIWFWVNGQTVCYNQWASGNDTGLDDCDKTVRSGVIRTNDNHWISRPETEENNFICIK